MKKIDSISLIKSLILICLSILLYKFVKNGYAINYVHDTTTPYILISSIIMAVMSFIILMDFSSTIRVRKKKRGFIVYLIPIISFSVLLVYFQGKDKIVNKFIDKTDMNISEDMFRVDDKNFNDFINGLNSQNTYTDGEIINITGFINRKKDDKNFYIARELMTCCTADLSILEVECYCNDSISIGEDTWVEAIGKINIDKKCIFIDRITEIDKPKNQYIHHTHK